MVLLKDEDRVNVDTVVPRSYVLDSRALLHPLRWLKGSTYKDLAQSYVLYAFHHYNTATIVLDSYNNSSPTKTNTHTRRSPIRCQDIVTNENNTFHSTQEKFLSNENKKTSIVTFISKYLDEGSQVVIQCDGDANQQLFQQQSVFCLPKQIILFWLQLMTLQ